MNNKHTFWQALVIALAIFWIGIVLGVMFENSRVDKLEDFYYDSETGIFDVILTGDLIKSENIECSEAITESIDFADRIYSEARTLEKYDSSNRITDDIVGIHKRYDLLRTMLWINLMELKENCGTEFGTNTVVYLYDYVDPSPEQVAKQGAISRVLLDLKSEEGDRVILIPIAYDTGVKSLELLLGSQDVEEIPSVIINEKETLEGLFTQEEIEAFLD